MKQGTSSKHILNWVLLGIALLALSGSVYFIHYLIFGDPHHIFIYLVGDIAFVPVEVLLVTLIIHRLLSMREKRALLNKLNMVVGVFFSDVGNPLIRRFAELDPRADIARERLDVKGRWAEAEFGAVRKFLEEYGYGVDSSKGDLEWLKGFLAEKKDFLLRLLENPNLLEHDSFTDLLWAVFHVAEELAHRQDLAALSPGDREHLEGDISRAYRLLASEWVGYMSYMKKEYPYLFSLAVRTNPFNPEARAEIS